MVSINPNFGSNGLSKLNKNQTTKEPPPKPETIIDGLQICRQKGNTFIVIYDDGVNDGKIIFLDADGNVMPD